MQRHQVNMPTDFYARIAQDVDKLAAEEGLHVDGRVISILEGGYSNRALFSGIMSHLSGLVGDQAPYKASRLSNGAAAEQDLGLASTPQYNTAWWGKRRARQAGTPARAAFAPQEAAQCNDANVFLAHAGVDGVMDPVKMRRSLSGLYAGRVVSRPPTPPPPEVPWVVAAHELSKLLHPRRTADRQLQARGSECRSDQGPSGSSVKPDGHPAGACRTVQSSYLKDGSPRAQVKSHWAH